MPFQAPSRLLAEHPYARRRGVQSGWAMQKIAILYDASQAVLSTFDLDEVLSQILCIMRDYFHLQHVAILLLDAKTNTLHARTYAGWNEESERLEIPMGRG